MTGQKDERKAQILQNSDWEVRSYVPCSSPELTKRKKPVVKSGSKGGNMQNRIKKTNTQSPRTEGGGG